MSLCLIMQEHDRIFVSVDTSTSYEIDEKFYRIGENGNKLYSFENQLIFTGGNAMAIKDIMQTYNNAEHNIESLHKIIKEKKDNYENLDIDFVIGTIENGESFVYQISSYNQFEIVKKDSVNKNNLGVYAAGICTEESVDLCIELISKKVSVNDIFINIYNKVANEAVGGDLIVCYLDEQGVHSLLHTKIIEKENLLRISDYYLNKEHYVMANVLVGKAVLSEKLTIADEDGRFDINGKNLTAKDDSKVMKTKIGNFKIDIIMEDHYE